MFNIKWGGVAAGAAFVLALTLSLLLGQTSLPIALLRAVIFAAVFFGLGLVAWLLINTFIPELLTSGDAGGGNIAANLFATDNSGSRVNITVDDEHDAAMPGQEYGAAGGGEIDDINDLFSPKDIDQTLATGYTEEEEETGDFAPVDTFAPATEEFASAFSDDVPNESKEEESGEFSMDFSAFVPGGGLEGGDGDGETEAPDSDADPFSFLEGGGAATFDEPPAPERKVSRNKPMQLEGDFNAKEIAAGLRTVLEKDKKRG